jgi:hypothetical protein
MRGFNRPIEIDPYRLSLGSFHASPDAPGELTDDSIWLMPKRI